MPNGIWGLIQFKGENALEAWKAYFVYNSLHEEKDWIKFIHYKENHLEFKYYYEYGMAGEVVLYFRNGEEVLHLDKKRESN